MLKDTFERKPLKERAAILSKISDLISHNIDDNIAGNNLVIRFISEGNRMNFIGRILSLGELNGFNDIPNIFNIAVVGLRQELMQKARIDELDAPKYTNLNTDYVNPSELDINS